MRRCGLFPALAVLFPLALHAQVPRTIQAVGTATIQAQPDQVKVDLGVTTTGDTATNAANQNAVLMTAVITAVQAVLGASARIQTIAYSITPNYRPNSSPPVLIGYTAQNTIEVTGSDMNAIVKVIDLAGPAGATTVTNLHFSISNDEQVREQALTAAAKQALAHASAIAAGLAGHAGNVLAAQEGVSVTPITKDLTQSASTPTPIIPGLVTVTANVTISVELTP